MERSHAANEQEGQSPGGRSDREQQGQWPDGRSNHEQEGQSPDGKSDHEQEGQSSEERSDHAFGGNPWESMAQGYMELGRRFAGPFAGPPAPGGFFPQDVSNDKANQSGGKNPTTDQGFNKFNQKDANENSSGSHGHSFGGVFGSKDGKGYSYSWHKP